MTRTHVAAWSAELDDFEARIELVEAALDGGDWDAVVPWEPPLHLAGTAPDGTQVERLRVLTARSEHATAAVRHALAAVGNELGSTRRQRTAAREYTRSDTHR
jgi:hypothetical protein